MSFVYKDIRLSAGYKPYVYVILAQSLYPAGNVPYIVTDHRYYKQDLGKKLLK
jgi:hypothetical protein